jgi:hypothetical protein
MNCEQYRSTVWKSSKNYIFSFHLIFHCNIKILTSVDERKTQRILKTPKFEHLVDNSHLSIQSKNLGQFILNSIWFWQSTMDFF